MESEDNILSVHHYNQTFVLVGRIQQTTLCPAIKTGFPFSCFMRRLLRREPLLVAPVVTWAMMDVLQNQLSKPTLTMLTPFSLTRSLHLFFEPSNLTVRAKVSS
jgi:hypothetical protein